MRRISCLILALLCLAGLPALAQEMLPGLDAADIALLTGAEGEGDSQAFDIDLQFEIGGVPEMRTDIVLSGSGAVGRDAEDRLLMHLQVAGTLDSAGVPAPVEVEARIVDDLVYQNDGTGWHVTPLAENMLGTVARNMSALGLLDSLGLMDFASGERLADAAGQAHFRITVDLESWLVSPGFLTLLGTGADAGDDESLAALAPMLAMLLSDPALALDVWLDLESGRASRMALDLSLGVNPAMLGSSDTGEAALALTLALDNMQYGLPVEVVAPEDVAPLT